MYTLFQVAVPIGGREISGVGPLGLVGSGRCGTTGANTSSCIFATTMTNIIGFLTVVAALWFIFNIIIAGFMWLSAGADKQKLADAQGKLTHSALGLAVVVVAIFLAKLITTLLGIDSVFNLISVIGFLTP